MVPRTPKPVRRDPVPPFTTAILQQEVSRRPGFGVRGTMSVAQGLHGGVALNGGSRRRRCRLRTMRNRDQGLRPTSPAIGRTESVQ